MAKIKRAPGIYETSKGVYEVVVSLGKDGAGKYRQRSLTVRGNLTQAKKARTGLLASIDNGTVTHTPKGLTMDKLFDRFIEARHSAAPNTVAKYRSLWTHQVGPEIGTTLAAKLRTIDLDQAYARIVKRVSPNTTKQCHKLVVTVLKQAMRWQLVPGNVALFASPPDEVRPTLTPPDTKAVQRLIAYAMRKDADFGALLHVAATTGARRGELAGLQWGDVDFEAKTLTISRQAVLANRKVEITTTKTVGSTRTIPLDADTLKVLRTHRANVAAKALAFGTKLGANAFVFSPKPGNAEPYRPDGITNRFAKIANMVGVACRFHDLRHFVGTQLVAKGIDVRSVADRLGHSSATITLDIYSHGVTEAQRQAADAMGALLR